MKKLYKTECIFIAVLLLAAALLSACTDSEKKEPGTATLLSPGSNSGKKDKDVLGFFQLKPEKVDGSIDITVQYSSEEAVSIIIVNNTAYKMTIDDPLVLCQKTIGEMYEALYPPISTGGVQHVYAGAEACIDPGKTRAVNVLPRPLKLTEGEYRIDLASFRLIHPETEEVSELGLTRYLYFSITG